MDKVAIYCRLSDEDRNKENKFDDSESIQNQKTTLTKYAIQNDWAIYNIYSDDDYSGLDKDRPEFNKMLKNAEEGKFNIILCKHQSRFTREMELVEKYIHGKFVEWGIRFISLNDNVDTNIVGGKKARQINGLVNEWYCEDISLSIKSVFRNKVEEGEFIGSFAPYGYKKDKKDKNKLIIDDEASEVVKLIFSLYLEGNGTQHIAYILNEKGIANPTRYKQMQGLKFVNSSQKDGFGLWNKTTVKRILKNEVYIGNMVQGKRKKISYKTKKIVNMNSDNWVIVENTHEPIIDEHTFLAVQKRMKNRARSTGTGRTHIFATKLRCMDCGSTMSKTSNINNVYLRCQLYARSPKEKLCTIHSIRLDDLENIVLEKLKKHFEVINNDFVAFQLEQKAELSKKINTLEQELEKVIKLIDEKTEIIKQSYIDKVKGLLDDNMFREINTVFIDEKESLLKRQQDIEKEIIEIQNKGNNVDKFRNIVAKYKNIDKLTHTIVNELIDYIEIGEKDKETKQQKIRIHWLF